MTRDELKAHALRQVEYCEEMARLRGDEPHRKSYEEHKLILELLENEQRWIPVSERLPEDYETVIASVDHEYVYPEARYSKEFGWEWDAESCSDYWTDLNGVDAWMPLPKAYQKEVSG